MTFESLRARTCEANRRLGASGLVTLTWGNASAVDREAGVLAIKPSGVGYDTLTPEDIVVLSLGDGGVVEGSLRPSSDAPTHLRLARAFDCVGGIVHTHSTHATAWCQAGRALPCLGTTHADHFFGTVPLVPVLETERIRADYEGATGDSIVERFAELELDPAQVPAALVAGHAPFVWGGDVGKALENAVALEESARMAILTLQLNPGAELPRELLKKHFFRKHGSCATYGQG